MFFKRSTKAAMHERVIKQIYKLGNETCTELTADIKYG